MIKKIIFIYLLATSFCFQELVGHTSSNRVLLNAEPFGFGPTAAIAEIFFHLKHHFSNISYIGCGHSLDLQRKLPYDEIFDYSAETINERKEKFIEIAKNFDIFITATDFEAASFAKELGLTLIIYDPLTWYWKKIPSVVAEADLYIAQNFFGVKERLQNEVHLFPNWVIVPAITSSTFTFEAEGCEQNLLVNLGGLSNPYTNPKDLEDFAKTVFRSIHETLEPNFDHTTYTSSKLIADASQTICKVTTLQPNETQTALKNSKLAIMTSGLGNIYEASSLNKKVIWLPPANDSQGQQIMQLKQHGMVDYLIDWSDIFTDENPIDYFASQEIVMEKIANYMKRLSIEEQAKTRFITLLSDNYKKAGLHSVTNLTKLSKMFGNDGAKFAAEAIFHHLSKE